MCIVPADFRSHPAFFGVRDGPLRLPAFAVLLVLRSPVASRPGVIRGSRTEARRALNSLCAEKLKRVRFFGLKERDQEIDRLNLVFARRLNLK